MKKIIIMATVLAPMLVCLGWAQDLDTVTVTDQFGSGSRSDQANGSAYAAPTYPDITGTINYYTTYEGGTAGETPVLDVTLATNDPDGAGPSNAIAGNTADTFSTSPNFAVFVGDGGGGQNLTFGEENDANYYVRAAVWCEPHTIASPPQFERIYISMRVPSLVGTTFNTISNTDAIGGYGLAFESDTATFLAVIWNPNNAGDLTGAAASTKDATSRTVIAESAAITAGGWHILEVSAYGATITWKVDGAVLAETTDGTFPTGQASLSYREIFTPTAPNEYQSRFDYMVAGPSEAPPVPASANDWQLYQ